MAVIPLSPGRPARHGPAQPEPYKRRRRRTRSRSGSTLRKLCLPSLYSEQRKQEAFDRTSISAAMNSSDRPPPPLLPPPVSPATPPPLLSLHPFPSPLFSDPLHHTSAKPLAGAPNPRARTKPELAGTSQCTEPCTEPCTECGKRFSSWKALFGHMRCHPERKWRGIKRPNHSQSFFSDEEYQVASTLVLLANGPPPAATQLDPGSLIRSLSSSLEGSIWRRSKGAGKIIKRRLESSAKSFGIHPSSSSSSSYRCRRNGCLLDLNMAPPLETGEGERNLGLDLKLGF